MGSVNKLLVAAAKKRVSTNTPSMGAQTLLHLDGSVVDTGSNPKVWTAGSGATSDVVNAKFGSSYAFDGVDAAGITTPIHSDFQFGGDFTIDFWVRLNVLGRIHLLAGPFDAVAGGGSYSWLVYVDASNHCVSRFLDTSLSTRSITGTIPLSSGTQTHIAFVRSGNSLLQFIDGTLSGSLITSAIMNTASIPVVLGNAVNASVTGFTALNGQIDEVRIIKGLAVWTSAFTPPTAPYSNTSGIYLSATGGTVTIDGNYKVHTFNASGTFNIATIGSNPVAGAVVEYLVIGGGGAGSDNTNAPGGGGAGGYRTAVGLAVAAQIYTVVVGAGSPTGSGSNSSFNGIVSIGGGGSTYASSVGIAVSGGSGQGSAYPNGALGWEVPGSGIAGQGYAGGVGSNWAGIDYYASGGGGGGGGVGGNSNAATSSGGAGGAGVGSSITGVVVARAGGGGGSIWSRYGNVTAGGVASAGGGTGQSLSSGIPAQHGVANTGGGGGCGISSGILGGAGGSGVVIIRYRFQ